MKVYIDLNSNKDTIVLLKTKDSPSLYVSENGTSLTDDEAESLIRTLIYNNVDLVYLHIDIAFRSRIAIRRLLQDRKIKYVSYSIRKGKEVIIG